MAAEEKMDNSSLGSSGSSAGTSAGSNKLVMILTLVNLLATVGMVAILVISFQREKKSAQVSDIVANASTSESEGKKEDGKAEAKDGKDGKDGAHKKPGELIKMVTLEQFTINLSTPGSVNPKFVRVNISIEVPNEDAESEVTSKMPQVRNTIIDLFNSKRPADLATGDGRDYLKEEIRNALNTFIVTGKVKGVFFTNFAVSS